MTFMWISTFDSCIGHHHLKAENYLSNLSTHISFSNGENLIVASDGKSASYLSTEEARKRIYHKKQEALINPDRLRQHGHIRGLFVHNVHRPSGVLVDKLIQATLTKTYAKNKKMGSDRRKCRVVIAL